MRVLVVEDDFRVAKVHVDFTHRVDGFEVAATARTAGEARLVLGERAIDLMLLDTYLRTPVRFVFADGGFAGRLLDWATQILATTISIVRKPADQRGFLNLKMKRSV